MEHGIDSSDPFGVGALFLGRSMADRFDCHELVQRLFAELLVLETPQFPNEPIATVLDPIDRLLDEIEPVPGMVELVEALFVLGGHVPPLTTQAQRLYRAVLWLMMRHDGARTTPEVVRMLREATPGTGPRRSPWPRHEFFATLLVLVYLGGPEVRDELTELLAAAEELGYHDLAPVLAWYLDHPHSAPAR